MPKMSWELEQDIDALLEQFPRASHPFSTCAERASTPASPWCISA